MVGGVRNRRDHGLQGWALRSRPTSRAAMTTIRFGTIVGLVLGSIWVFAGFLAALLVAVLATVGAVIAAVVTGRVDLAEYLGHQHD
jgi:hypothetical protein